MDIDVGVATADVRQKLREGVPGKLTHETGGSYGALREQTIDLAGRYSRIEEGDDDRAVDPGAVEVNVRRDDPGQVRDGQAVAEGSAVVAQAEGGQPGRQRGARRRGTGRQDFLGA